MFQLIPRFRILPHFFQEADIGEINATEFPEIEKVDKNGDRQRQQGKKKIRIGEFHQRLKVINVLICQYADVPIVGKMWIMHAGCNQFASSGYNSMKQLKFFLVFVCPSVLFLSFSKPDDGEHNYADKTVKATYHIANGMLNG